MRNKRDRLNLCSARAARSFLPNLVGRLLQGLAFKASQLPLALNWAWDLFGRRELMSDD